MHSICIADVSFLIVNGAALSQFCSSKILAQKPNLYKYELVVHRVYLRFSCDMGGYTFSDKLTYKAHTMTFLFSTLSKATLYMGPDLGWRRQRFNVWTSLDVVG